MRDIIELGHMNFKNNVDGFLLHWDITSRCNYRCAYCDYKNRSEDFISYVEKTRILEFIRYISEKKDLIPVLFGGEPTLDPDFLKVIKNFPKLRAHPIIIYTNLSMSINFWKKLCDLNRKIRITTSYHYTESNFSTFRRKILYLLDRGIFVRLKVMWDCYHKVPIRNIFNLLKELEKDYPNNCFCTLDIVYGPDQSFTKDELSWYESIQDCKQYYIKYDSSNGPIYEETAFNLIKMRAHKYHNSKVNLKLYKCDCGKKCLFITSHGDVHYCQTMRKNEKQPIFNIHNDDYRDYLHIFDKHIICMEDNCHSEISVPKYRILNYVGQI